MAPLHRISASWTRTIAFAFGLSAGSALAADDAPVAPLPAEIAALHAQAEAARLEIERLGRQLQRARESVAQAVAARRAAESELVKLRFALRTECVNRYALTRYGEHANAAATNPDAVCD